MKEINTRPTCTVVMNNNPSSNFRRSVSSAPAIHSISNEPSKWHVWPTPHLRLTIKVNHLADRLCLIWSNRWSAKLRSRIVKIRDWIYSNLSRLEHRVEHLKRVWVWWDLKVHLSLEDQNLRTHATQLFSKQSNSRKVIIMWMWHQWLNWRVCLSHDSTW